jgi:hypothetical protein
MNTNEVARSRRAPLRRLALLPLASVAFLLSTATLAPAAAQTQPAATLPLIPPPQEIQLSGKGGFTVTAKTHIAGPAESVAVVKEVLAERVNLLSLGAGAGGITVAKPRDPADRLWQHDQAYLLTVKSSGISIEATDNTGAFYAAQTLAQLIQNNPAIPALVIRDWPAIKTRLAMIATDQGGFQVIDVEYWKRIIRELAALKLNAVMPYFDGGTYKYRKYPFLGAKGDDGFTLEKAKLLSDYASKHFVQLIPQQNSIGHLAGVLSHKELQHLRDGGGTINTVMPETFAFLGDLYDELVEAFPNAPAIHVGGDEFGHDFGKSPLVAARVAQVGKAAVYGEFMTKLHAMLKQRNRSMMIWWNEQGFTIEAGPLMPKDIAVFDWHYNAQKDYPSLDNLLKAGFTAPWATPAVTRYYDGSNDWGPTFANIHNFAVAGAKRNVPGLCTCTWVHGMWGGRNMFELNLYGLAYSAECGWNPSAEVEAAAFARKFAAHWLGCQDANAETWVTEGIQTPYGEPKEQKFWRDNRSQETYAGSSLMALTTLVKASPALETDAKALLGFCDRAEAALDSLRKSSTRNLLTLDYFKHDVRIQRLAANRVLAAAELMRWSAGLNIPKPVPEKELVRLDFTLPPAALAKAAPGAKISEGVLITCPGDNWKSDGLTVGPMPLPEAGALVEFDMQLRQFGQQFQQFASGKPSTHHYMVFVGPDRKFHLYTLFGKNWGEQGTLGSACVTGTWYRCAAVIKKDSLSFKATDRATGKVVCRSGIVPMDAVGPDLMFTLTDSHGDAGPSDPATEWDNVAVSALKKIPEQAVTPPAELFARLNRLIADHTVIEETFRKSVLEAGGGSADTGNLGKGAMQFRSKQGREDTEHLIRDLTSGRLPASFDE